LRTNNSFSGNFQQGKIVLKALHWAFFYFPLFFAALYANIHRAGEKQADLISIPDFLPFSSLKKTLDHVNF